MHREFDIKLDICFFLTSFTYSFYVKCHLHKWKNYFCVILQTFFPCLSDFLAVQLFLWWSICFSVCLFVFWSVCVSLFLSANYYVPMGSFSVFLYINIHKNNFFVFYFEMDFESFFLFTDCLSGIYLVSRPV